MWFNVGRGPIPFLGQYLLGDELRQLAPITTKFPPPEWPIFGSVFFLVTAEDLHSGRAKSTPPGEPSARPWRKRRRSWSRPETATWVRTKWGDAYLERENVFYRMLLILGLSSYENITHNRQYHGLMSRQRIALADELGKAKLHLRDDYPDECYPGDMLWAVAAIQRAARLDNARHDGLAKDLMAAFDGPVKAAEGLPAFQAEARSGGFCRARRGCGNSGILLFAAELDPAIAGRWYDAYRRNFWKDTGWIAGFTEMPRERNAHFVDVDSGPVLFGIGSVSTSFGIGAAKAAGRIDDAAPLTMEVVAVSWPTPFGFLIPGLMGRVAVKSWSLGEVALLFSMTRPTHAAQTSSLHRPHAADGVAAAGRLCGRGAIFHRVRGSELSPSAPAAPTSRRRRWRPQPRVLKTRMPGPAAARPGGD